MAVCMKIAIMQPYFFPYIGYYKLISEVDRFVIYDDIQFTKKGWINRNYLNSVDGPWLFSIPIENSSKLEFIKTKRISNEFNRGKMQSRIRQNYRKISTTQKLDFVDKIIEFPTNNLFDYLENSLLALTQEIGIDSKKILRSSQIGDFSGYKGEEKVVAICTAVGATAYVNPHGGQLLYNAASFDRSGISLHFQNRVIPSILTKNHGVPHFSFLHEYLTLSKEELDLRIKA